MSRNASVVGLLLLLALLCGCSTQRGLVREQRVLSLPGQQEVWKLMWTTSPGMTCGADDLVLAGSCPCGGVAYGEFGDLVVLRERHGRVIDRLNLTPLFATHTSPEPGRYSGQAFLQRRPLRFSDRLRAVHHDPALLDDMKTRPATEILNWQDYDHDGQASEFLLQVAAGSCGSRELVAVGTSLRQPRLHVLTTVDHPELPLVLPLPAWQQLRDSATPTEIAVRSCGEQGSTTRLLLRVSAENGGIYVREREFSCPASGEAPKELRNAPR